MDLYTLVNNLKALEIKQLALVETIKSQARQHGIPLTSNMTACNKPNCLSCKLGFHHGFYFITQVNGQKRRIKQSELFRFLMRFADSELINEYKKVRKQRHMLLIRLNNIVRWYERENRDLKVLFKYLSPQPALCANIFEQVKDHDGMKVLTEKGVQLLSKLFDAAIVGLDKHLHKTQ